MRRLMTFLTGMLTGGLLIYVAMYYYLVRADDGLHVVRKLEAKLAGTYTDIRNFEIADWSHHTDLAAAMVAAGKRDLMRGAATDSLQQSLEGFLNRREE